jgi:DNA-binding beta-propeller fold protein YncE
MDYDDELDHRFPTDEPEDAEGNPWREIGTLGHADMHMDLRGSDPWGPWHDSNPWATWERSMQRGRILEATASIGRITLLAGSGNPGFKDGRGSSASFHGPINLAIQSKSPCIIVADTMNNRVCRVSPDGVSETLAGSGWAGFADGTWSTARFTTPVGVAVDSQGNVVVADCANSCIRKISPEGVVSTIAGCGWRGFRDGRGAQASFNDPMSVATSPSGDIIVADSGNNSLRRISPEGVVSTIAGQGWEGYGDGPGKDATFRGVNGAVVDADGVIIACDCENYCIRRISTDGYVATLAGSGWSEFVDGQGTSASFSWPHDVALDGDGNVIVADGSDRTGTRIRKVTPDGCVSTLAEGGWLRDGDSELVPIGFEGPVGVVVDRNGDVIVACNIDHCLYKVVANLTPPGAGKTAVALPSLSQDMQKALTDSTFADVTFVVDGVSMIAHRVILSARSEYFHTMLTSSFREGIGGSTDRALCGGENGGINIEIQDTTPGAFKALLHFLYTDQLDIDDSEVIHVMHLAHRYNIQALVNNCTQYCLEFIDTHNAIPWLAQAHEYRLDRLKALAVKFVAMNLRRIREENRLDELSAQPELLMDVINAV